VTDLLAVLQTALADRYTLERELGRGGMATVYLARDLKHDRSVAIKAVLPHIAAALGPDRFLREITTIARLQHPHILGLLDSGEFEGQLYYIMPFVAGESLRDRLEREHQLPLEEALRITREVADGLDYAHRQGLIHRDIKPENILLSDRHAMVADFGIARAIEQAGGAKLTETGLAVGTPDYMSPEQAAGDAELDGRTDQYSLGCVLYEMLAGHPPFLGKNPQEVRARHALDSVPPLRSARATISDALDSVLQRALAKQPADRFADIAEFAAALEAPLTVPVQLDHSPPRGQRRYRQIGWATLILGALTGAIALLKPKPTDTLNSDLVAIAPFEVLDSSLALWREGMGDVLSRYLDGAGPLSTVSQTVVFKHWAGRSDRSSATALGQRTGAGLVVFGNAISKGGDSVLLRASVLRLAEGGATEEVEVAGEQERMGDLADSLGHGILEALGRSRPIGAVRQASLGAGSLPALKAFLRGEQLYRRGHWDSALVHYDRALELDSGFALANRRMAVILWFDPPTTHSYQPWPEYALRAGRLNHGLSARDSLLIVGLARWVGLGSSTDNPTYLSDFRDAGAAFEQATDRYPNDPEAWYFRGEFLYHTMGTVGVTDDPLAAFERGIALDSSFSPLYEHTVELALRQGSPDLALRHARAYLALGTDDDQATKFRLEAMLLERGEQASAEADRLLDTVRAWGALWNPMGELNEWPDSAETAVRIARIFPGPRRDYTGAPDFVRDSLVQKRRLSSMLVTRGHLREAYAVVPEADVEGWPNRFLDLALFGIAPAAAADEAFGRLLRSDSLWPPASEVGPRQDRALVWWLARRDTTSLARFARRADAVGHATAAPFARLQVSYLSDAARAYLLLLRGDSAAALKALETLPDSMCPLVDCVFQNLTRARLLAASRRDQEAAQVLDRWLPALAGTLFVLGRLERGRVAERLGDREKAIKSYSYVADAWRRADPELQPYVAEARAGLQRLTTEPRP